MESTLRTDNPRRHFGLVSFDGRVLYFFGGADRIEEG
jgi:hypothetical protein